MPVCQEISFGASAMWIDEFIDPRIEHVPTIAEIAEACAAIRSRWTPCEKRRRFVGAAPPDDDSCPWRPPVIDTSSLRARMGGVENS
ncbi:MAG: hypothetical protein KDA37_11305 [Planctomycetales bacterium]|nr:hypothetical protein [Planctomycetales bacterium]